MKINLLPCKIIFNLTIFAISITLFPLKTTAADPCSFPVFSNGTAFQTGQSPFSVASGDINNDGKLDAVTSNFYNSNDSLSVFWGDGSGSFEPARTFNADT